MVCVLEGLYDLGNIGAVARSAEAFGITQVSDSANVHFLIEKRQLFQPYVHTRRINSWVP